MVDAARLAGAARDLRFAIAHVEMIAKTPPATREARNAVLDAIAESANRADESIRAATGWHDGPAAAAAAALADTARGARDVRPNKSPVSNRLSSSGAYALDAVHVLENSPARWID